MAALNEPSANGFYGQTRASYAAMLKQWYAKRWDDAIHEGNWIISKLGKKGESFGGSKVVSAVVTGFPQSAGISSRENRGLPTARVGTQINPELVARDFYTLLAWSGQSERSAARGDKAAWAKPRTLDMQLARKQADINLCRKLYLAYADVLGAVASYNGTTDVATLQPRNSRTSSGEAYWYHGAFYMRVNQSVGFAETPLGSPTYDIEGGTTGTQYEQYISAIGGTQAAPTITLLPGTPQVDPAAGGMVVPFHNRASSVSATAADAITQFSGFNGIGNMCTDDTIYAALFGLAKADAGNECLNGVYDENGGTVRNYEEKRLALLVDRIRDEGTGNEPKFTVMHSSTRREVVAEHDGDRRYAPVQTDSGYGQLVAHVGDTELPYYSDWLCQPGMVVALNPDTWSWLEQSAMGPIDQSLERWVTGFDQHQIIWHKSGNFECQAPFDQGIIDDIDIDVYSINV